MATQGRDPHHGGGIERCCAKLNLSLAVIARRADGFHEIESLMVPVSLSDTIRGRRRKEPGVGLRVRFAGPLATRPDAMRAHDVPADGSNLVVRAVAALASAAGVSEGLEIDLVKRIPAGAGLGGGSSDAAAGLRLAARLWRLDWPAARLAELGAGIGSDIPWFCAGVPAIARGRGELLEAVPRLPALAAVIACPATGLSTAAVYAGCRPDPSRRGEAARLAVALARGGLEAARPFLHNTLEDAARSLSPDVGTVLTALETAGGFAPRLTGSGSACFALARSVREARGVAARLHAATHGLCPAVFVVRLAPQPGRVAAA